MNNARNVAQNREQNVDEKVGIATALKEDTERRKNDGKDDFDDVAIWRISLVRDASSNYKPTNLPVKGIVTQER